MGPLLKFEGGAAAPKSVHGNIKLVAQEVTIRLRKQTYIVEAVFHFLNTGKTSTEWVGFPKRGFYGATLPNSPYAQPLDNFIWFKAWVHGRRAILTEERDVSHAPRNEYGKAEERRWLAHQVAFPGCRETTMRCAYQTHYVYDNAGKAASYLYGTGALWKGNIGSGVFLIDASNVGGTKNISVEFPVASGPRLLSINLMKYEIRDFKPPLKGELVIHVREGSQRERLHDPRRKAR